MPRKSKKKIELNTDSLQVTLTEIWSEAYDVRGKCISNQNKIMKLINEIYDDNSMDVKERADTLKDLLKSHNDLDKIVQEALKKKVEVVKVQKDAIAIIERSYAEAEANGNVPNMVDKIDPKKLKEFEKQYNKRKKEIDKEK